MDGQKYNAKKKRKKFLVWNIYIQRVPDEGAKHTTIWSCWSPG